MTTLQKSTRKGKKRKKPRSNDEEDEVEEDDDDAWEPSSSSHASRQVDGEDGSSDESSEQGGRRRRRKRPVREKQIEHEEPVQPEADAAIVYDAPAGDEESLGEGSELDLSDDEPDTENVVLCQYETITRVKNKV
jgi:hypothetical protein